MLFEDFDKKIKEAADQHHPAYDEKAWQKMEKLLNQHLPQQKDDRRRILFSLLLLILIGGGAYFVMTKPRNQNDATTQVVRENKPKDQARNIEKTNAKSTNSPNTDISNISPYVNGNDGTPETENINIGKSSIKSPLDKKPGSTIAYNNVQRSKTSKSNQNVLLKNDNGQERNRVAADHIKKNELNANVDNTKPETYSNSTGIADNGETKTAKSNDLVAKNELKTSTDEQISKPLSKNPARQKKTLNNRNGFSFFVSAGPDVSKAGYSKTGKTTLLYGAGIGYTRNQITLRTGIYASKKIYWAGSRDYELSYMPTPPTKFEGADANCDVIDIPIKLSYAFGLQNKGNWFAGAGLSSYLMKKEKYVYTYKTAATTFYYPYQTKNENKHYFSILNLSAGYTRQVNNTISLTVEPYAEIPLTGIGVGKVHLNSGGVLFSVGVRPFKK